MLRRRFIRLSSCVPAASLLGGCATRGTNAPSADGRAPSDDASRTFERALSQLTAHPPPLPPPPAAFASRRERAGALLNKHECAALVITPSTNLRYFAGFSWWLSERFLAWVLIPGQTPLLVVPAFERGRVEERLAHAQTPADVVIWREHQDPVVVLQQALQTRGVASGKLAVDPACPLRFAAALVRVFGQPQVVNAAPITDGLRSVKSEHELRCLRAANAITLDALRFVFAQLRPGLSSSTIGAWVKRAQVQLGGEHPWALSLVGPAAAFPHGTAEPGILDDGVGLLIDTGIAVHGYQSDLSRTVLFRKDGATTQTAAIDTFLSTHALVREAQARALKAIAPKVSPAHVDNIARAFLSANGFGPSDRFFTHRLGHGIGLDGHEAPYLVGGNQTPFVVGNTASCEPGVYVKGAYGIRVEDIFVVTPSGAETLGPPQTGPFVEDV